MSILRSYIDKNNTITSNTYVNTARNPVMQLNFGASDFIVPNFGYTRYLFDLDLLLLRNNIEQGIISTGCTSAMTHTLKMTNTSSFDTELLNTFMSDERRRATSFDLIFSCSILIINKFLSYRNPLNPNVAPKVEINLVRRRSPPSFTAKLLKAQGGGAH